jgi:hypothetical protein
VLRESKKMIKMIKMNSYVSSGGENTGVANAKVIQMYGNKKKRVASYGDMIYSIIKSLNKASGNLLDEKQRKEYKTGLLQRAIIVLLKKIYNLKIIVDKKVRSLRIRTLIPGEVAFKYRTIIFVSNLKSIMYNKRSKEFFFNKISLNKVFENNTKKREVLKQKQRIILRGVKKKVIKRYYNRSNYNLGKDKLTTIGKAALEKLISFPVNVVETVGKKIIEISKYNDTMTKKNVSTEYKIQNNLSNKQMGKNIESANIKEYQHRGIVEAVNEDNESVELTCFTPITSKSTHPININYNDKEKFILIKTEKDSIINNKLPTISMQQPIKIDEGFTINNISLVITPIAKKIKLNENNVYKLQKGLVKELQEKKGEFMELVG